MLKMTYNLPCVSQRVCDAALRKQTLVYNQLKRMRNAAHARYPPIIQCLFHISSIVLQNDMDLLLVYFSSVQHLLGCLLNMLCCMKPAKLRSVQ